VPRIEVPHPHPILWSVDESIHGLAVPIEIPKGRDAPPHAYTDHLLQRPVDVFHLQFREVGGQEGQRPILHPWTCMI